MLLAALGADLSQGLKSRAFSLIQLGKKKENLRITTVICHHIRAGVG